MIISKNGTELYRPSETSAPAPTFALAPAPARTALLWAFAHTFWTLENGE